MVKRGGDFMRVVNGFAEELRRMGINITPLENIKKATTINESDFVESLFRLGNVVVSIKHFPFFLNSFEEYTT